jgi:DNA-binding PadR family transcriptional regulator
MNIFCEDAPRYYLRILMYLADRPMLSEDATDCDLIRKFTAYGLSEELGISISSTYTSLRWLEAAGMLVQLPRPLRLANDRPTRAYRLTRDGKEYAAALRIFQQSVEAIR